MRAQTRYTIGVAINDFNQQIERKQQRAFNALSNRNFKLAEQYCYEATLLEGKVADLELDLRELEMVK